MNQEPKLKQVEIRSVSMKRNGVLPILVFSILLMCCMLNVNLCAMEFVTTSDTNGQVRGIKVYSDQYLLAADGTAGLKIFDHSDVSTLKEVSRVQNIGDVYAIDVYKTYAYLAARETGLVVVDLTNPLVPRIANIIDTPDRATDVLVDRNFLFIADRLSGVLIYNIADVSNPQLISQYNTPANALGLCISENRLYVADYWSGLQVIDISDITNPTLLGSLKLQWKLWDVKVKDRYAYVVGEGSGLQVVDVTNPQKMTIVGSYHTPDLPLSSTAIPPYSLYLSGSYALVPDGYSGLQVIDIANPTDPQSVDALDLPGYSWGIDVKGNYAYIGSFHNGIHVIEVGRYSGSKWIISRLTVNDTWDVFPVVGRGKIAWKGHFNGVGDSEVLLWDGLRILNLSNNNLSNECEPYTDGKNVAWRSYKKVGDAYQGVIWFYDGTSAYNIATYDLGPYEPYSGYPPSWHSLAATTYNGDIVWAAWDGSDYEIYLWRSGNIVQITNDNVNDIEPVVHDGKITWTKTDGINPSQIYFWDGNTSIRIPNNNRENWDSFTFGGKVVWAGFPRTGDAEIFYWDGAQTLQITDNSGNDFEPVICGDNVFWNGFDGYDWEIYYWTRKDGVRPLTDNDVDDLEASCSENFVTWHQYTSAGPTEIMYGYQS